MLNVLVAPFPFAQGDATPKTTLEGLPGMALRWNPHSRKLTKPELIALMGDVDVVIAGTEVYDRDVLLASPRLKLIARVGIGLDNVDRKTAHERGIKVTYTPDAPAPAVAELTIGHMLALARGVVSSHEAMRRDEWQRIVGRRLEHMTIGILGTGRVGSRVLRLLGGFGVKNLLVHDVKPNSSLYADCGARHVPLDILIRQSDIVSLHVPLTEKTKGMIAASQLAAMRRGSFLINTARGELINEAALVAALARGPIAGAACDVFAEEPYHGPLREVPNVILTAHLGSCSVDCRRDMEMGAVNEVDRFACGLPPAVPVSPTQEY